MREYIAVRAAMTLMVFREKYRVDVKLTLTVMMDNAH